MEDSKAMTTPMSTTTTLDADEEGEHVDQKEYRRMIGSLLYLTATSRTSSSRYVLRSFSSVSEDFASASGEANFQVLRPLVIRVFFFSASWFFRHGFCRVSVG
jgi:hypothetical protein